MTPTNEPITAEVRQRGLRLETDKEKLALSLKTYRLRAGLSQNEIAQKWGCSRYTIMRIEGGKPVTWEMMYRVFNELQDALLQEQFEKSKKMPIT